MILLALLGLLTGCRCGEATPPASAPKVEAPAPVEIGPDERQPDDVPTLFEEVVTTDVAATGLRLRPDGASDLAVGTPTDLAWWPVDRLAPDALARVREDLAAEDLATVPDVLPPLPDDRPGTPTARVRYEGPDGVRTITVPGYGARRIPSIERIEAAVRGGEVRPVHTRWQITRDGGDLVLDVPCDPATIPKLKPVTRALLDRAARPQGALTDETPVRLRITWGTGSRVWQTVMHDSGLVVRGSEKGPVTGHRITKGAVDAVRTILDDLGPSVTCP